MGWPRSVHSQTQTSTAPFSSHAPALYLELVQNESSILLKCYYYMPDRTFSMPLAPAKVEEAGKSHAWTSESMSKQGNDSPCCLYQWMLGGEKVSLIYIVVCSHVHSLVKSFISNFFPAKGFLMEECKSCYCLW
jgi:hypothetical protein